MPGRRTLTLLLIAAALLVVALPASAGRGPGAAPAAQTVLPTDQIVVGLAAGAALDTGSLAATTGVDLKPLRRLGDGAYVLRLPQRSTADVVRALANALAARTDVLFAEPDALMEPLGVPTEPRWSEQWDMFAPVAGAYGIDLPGARELTLGAPSITIGVIDTGYRPHADLAGRFVPGYDFISNTLTANDGDGRDADAADPGDWITSAENQSGAFAGCGARSSSWHGTHVSGTIGAVAGNGVGIAGINQVSKIQPLRVLGKCGGYMSDIADAIRWGAGLPVAGVPANPTPNRVLNLSLGGSGACASTYQSAINDAVAAGTVVVVAAGNSNANAANFQPASCANVITVAATGHTGSRAYYSNYGSTVEIAAPGGDSQLGQTILSTLNDGATGPAADAYANYQGTSMATPHVVGVVSLMLSVNSGLTPSQVSTLVGSSATPFPAGSSCTTSLCGSGIVNAASAVAAAGGGGPPGPPDPPGGFSKTSPSNGAKSLSTSVTLAWGASAAAGSYQWCVSTQSGSCSTWTSTGSRSAAVRLARRTTYFWQVRAVSTGGTTYADGGSWWSLKTR